MSFKKVGIAQDSNLRGDSLRLQNPDNTLAYSEFVYDGSATMSYTLPSSAGTSGQVLQISSGTTLVWSSAVGPQGPIGPTGLPGSSGSSGTSGSSGSSGASGTSGSSGSSGANGAQGPAGSSGSSGSSGANGSSGTSGLSSTVQSYNTSGGFVNVTFLDENGTTLVPIPVGADGSSGSSGSSGQDGVNGAAGSSGSSGSSGANGVGNATISGDVNYVPKYIGLTALGTASMIAVGEQVRFNDGSAATPSISFQNATGTGLYRSAAGHLVLSRAGSIIAYAASAQFVVLPGTVSFPGLAFDGDSDTGIYRLAENDMGFAVGGNQRFRIADTALLSQVPFRIPDGTVTTPSLTFLNDLDTGIFRNGDNRIGFAAGGATAAIIDGQGLEVIPGSQAAPSISFIGATSVGIYYSNDNVIRFVQGNNERFIIATDLISSQNSAIRSNDGSRTAPAYRFISGQQSGLYYITGATPQVGLAVQSVTASSFGQTSSTIFSGGVANARFGLTNSIANQTFFNRAVNHTPVTAVATASYVMDMSQSNVFLLTLTASTTLDYTNAQIGSYVIVATQNATGNYSMSLATGKFQGATWSGVATASNAKTIIQVIYDGSKGIITSQKITDL